MTAFDQDAFLMQWFGHGSRFRWGSVSMFRNTDPPSWPQTTRGRSRVTYACWTGYFINLFTDRQTLGETLLLTPQRGSVADLSPSGLHVGDALLVLDKGLTQAVFSHRIERLGQAIDEAKAYYFGHSSSFRDVIDTSVLFGDPALRLRLPDPLLANSSVAVARDWMPPGMPLAVTATLVNSGAVATTVP